MIFGSTHLGLVSAKMCGEEPLKLKEKLEPGKGNIHS